MQKYEKSTFFFPVMEPKAVTEPIFNFSQDSYLNDICQVEEHGVSKMLTASFKYVLVLGLYLFFRMTAICACKCTNVGLCVFTCNTLMLQVVMNNCENAFLWRAPRSSSGGRGAGEDQWPFSS